MSAAFQWAIWGGKAPRWIRHQEQERGGATNPLAALKHQPLGYLAPVLHAHLPFVRHPEHEDFLEEDWFYEAITETYIPLLWMLDGLVRDRIDFRLTLSLSPTLVAMLDDELLRRRYSRHLDLLCELADKEVRRTRHQPQMHETASMYKRRFQRARQNYRDRWKSDLVGAFQQYQESRKLEIITSAATHGFLPLLRFNPAAVRAQIQVAVQHHTDRFGRAPGGIWLPECGYYPGLDEILKEAGLRYFFLDAHGIHNASGRTKFGVYAPLYSPAGVAAFGRDPESSKQVWSSKEGYPGDFDYREFYRDIGFDLDLEYIRPYIHPDGIRINTGFKYYRVTGPGETKEPYVPQQGLEKAAIHAEHFIVSRKQQVEWLRSWMDRKPIIVAPYDAELFGHWWFEGPDWIDFLIRKLASDRRTLQLTTPTEYLAEYPVNQEEIPSASSWGLKGYNTVWLNGSNDWIYRHLHAAADRMSELAEEYPSARGTARRALNQAARELLLAQSSDWAFIMSKGTAVEYAARRAKEHLLRFNDLYRMVKTGGLDRQWLTALERRDNIFPRLDYRIYRIDRKVSLAPAGHKENHTEEEENHVKRRHRNHPRNRRRPA
jgi:1,4-alpha-glucan branching enzyme